MQSAPVVVRMPSSLREELETRARESECSLAGDMPVTLQGALLASGLVDEIIGGPGQRLQDPFAGMLARSELANQRWNQPLLYAPPGGRAEEAHRQLQAAEVMRKSDLSRAEAHEILDRARAQVRLRRGRSPPKRRKRGLRAGTRLPRSVLPGAPLRS